MNIWSIAQFVTLGFQFQSKLVVLNLIASDSDALKNNLLWKSIGIIHDAFWNDRCILNAIDPQAYLDALQDEENTSIPDLLKSLKPESLSDIIRMVSESKSHPQSMISIGKAMLYSCFPLLMR